MNICIGGPWHGSKLLASRDHQEFFKINDKKIKLLTTYIKKVIKVGDTVCIFWVSNELSDDKASELIKPYLNIIERDK